MMADVLYNVICFTYLFNNISLPSRAVVIYQGTAGHRLRMQEPLEYSNIPYRDRYRGQYSKYVILRLILPTDDIDPYFYLDLICAQKDIIMIKQWELKTQHNPVFREYCCL